MKENARGEVKPVGVWIRVSTEDQARGESPEHHERRARYYAEAKGWNVLEVYHLEGVSGKDVTNHPETKRMLADVRTKRVTGLIFSKLARLARDTRQLLDFADNFRDAGADLISLGESIDTATPAGRLFFTIIAAMATWEREEIVSRVSASVAIRAKLGKSLGGAAPFGYAWKNKVLVINPAEATVRRLMYKLFAEHKRKKTVARLLNGAGHRTRNGSKFSDTTVGRLILDPTAKGKQRLNYTKSSGQNKAWEYKPESEWQYVDVEPIVSVDLWNTCANLLGNGERKRRRPAKRAVHLFAGLTYCTCGAKMYIPSNSKKYTCTVCKNKIPDEDLESVYVNELKGFFMSHERIQNVLTEANAGLAALEADLGKKKPELAKLQAEINRVIGLFVETKLSSDEFGPFLRRLEDRKKEIADDVAKLEAEVAGKRVNTVSAETVVGEASDLYGRWSGFEREEKRRIIESLTDNLIVGDGEIAVNLKYLPSLEELTKEQRNLKDSSPKPT